MFQAVTHYGTHTGVCTDVGFEKLVLASTVNSPADYSNIVYVPCINGPGSSVGIATGYGLDGPGIECRWGRDFSHLSRPALGPTQLPVQWVPGISRG
jgi:hypothetical protein